jgi:hypothetical protein
LFILPNRFLQLSVYQLKEKRMTKKFVEEAPYHPGYEDAGFKSSTSPVAAELDSFRKSNSRYLNFADVIVNFCASEQLKHSLK